MKTKNISFSAFRTYDIRGIYGKEINKDIAYNIGKALVSFLNCKEIVIGKDMRISSPILFKALAKGINNSGADVIDIGIVDTPSIYFASGFYKKAAIMITASHNPRIYNGFKIVKAGAVPISFKTGLKDIKRIIKEGRFKVVKRKGRIIKKNIFMDYRKHVLSFINYQKFDSIKLVIDAGKGVAKKIIPLIYNGLGIKLYVLDSIKRKSILNLKRKVKEIKADFGMAFDIDTDRIVFIDERGRYVEPSYISALLAKHLLSTKKRKESIVFDLVSSKIFLETIKKYGGKPLMEKVGHPFIEDRMKKEKALFGAENSGHYYYQSNYFSDSALITSLIISEIYYNIKKNGKRFSDLIEEFDKYYKIKERDIKIKDAHKVIERVERIYKKGRYKKINKLDGLTVEFDDWWFNVRTSKTEPLLRVNLEANNIKLMRKKLKEVLTIIKKY